MDLLNRSLSKKEIILIAFMSILVLALAYYKFIYLNISDALTSARADASALETELQVAQVKVAEIQKMEKELEGYKSTGIVAKMGSYNNSSAETYFLNTVLSNVDDYAISFSDVTRDGDLIRRNFTLQYKTSNYKKAEKVMENLTSGEYRCLIGDVSCSVADDKTTMISLQGTFYETMVGGKPDSALPADEAETKAELDPTVEAAYAK